MSAFKNKDGTRIVFDVIAAIQEHKSYLSEVDGAIGDGDHGINMNKGFTLCGEELRRRPGDLAHSLRVLSKVLMGDIGGSMGPLYGTFFRAMSKIVNNREEVDSACFGEMLKAAEEGVRSIGNAQPGDKTLLDTLVPAIQAYQTAVAEGRGFGEALDAMKDSAIEGKESTKDMVAKVGRASRLGERSRGVIDPGAASCCIILTAMADAIKKLPGV